MKTIESMSVWDFGEQLLSSNDLDPIYCMLWEAQLPREDLLKWILSYWCHYHSGTACWTVDQPDFFKALMEVAQSKEYPRCMERRHFRGQNAVKSVTDLRKQTVKERLDPIANGTEILANDLMKYIQQWVGFGPWIAFKAADMIERLGLAKVRFDVNNITLFDSPREGAERMYLKYGNPEVKPDNLTSWAVKQILYRFRGLMAPPRFERYLNVQEAETILCKWKSHCNGHYQPGEDIESLKKTLLHYQTPTSAKLLKAYNKLWK